MRKNHITPKPLTELKQKVTELPNQEQDDKPPEHGEREHHAAFLAKIRLFHQRAGAGERQ